MKSVLTAVLLVVLLPVLALAQVTADQEKQAVAAAKNWLALCDAGKYAESWKEASGLFKGLMAEKAWTDALTGGRKPLGAVTSRTESSVKSASSLPGAPDGHYVVMTFATSFANKKDAVETVTFLLDTDGTWRAAGYLVK